MKSRYLNFICVPVAVAILVLLVAGVLGAGFQLLAVAVGELLPESVFLAITACFAILVLSSFVWLSLGKQAAVAIGKFCCLVVCTFAVLDWLVSDFQLWPPYASYLLPIVSAYLVMSLFPSCLNELYETMKEKAGE